MKLALLTLLAFPLTALGDVRTIPGSASPNGKIHAVVDIDRDPTLKPEWKDGNFPQIEITEIGTGKVL